MYTLIINLSPILSYPIILYVPALGAPADVWPYHLSTLNIRPVLLVSNYLFLYPEYGWLEPFGSAIHQWPRVSVDLYSLHNLSG